MDTTQRKEFDNQYYNHQEAIKEIVERYVDEINILKTELSTKN